MSRLYEMHITVEGVRSADEAKKIEELLVEEWNWDNFEQSCSPTGLMASGQSSLCGAEDEPSFARRCFRAVLKATGRAVPVGIQCTCLEDQPHEDFSLDEDEAEELLAEIDYDAGRCEHGMFLAGAGACPACREK
jgi:hypothetical protein